MFDHRHYVPILKAKQGELLALRHLSTPTKEALTPLIEMVPVPWDFNNEQPSKELSQHLDDKTDDIAKAWGTEAPFFLETRWIEEVFNDDGVPAAELAFAAARAKGLEFIPVIGSDSTAILRGLVRNCITQDDRGVCIRISGSSLGRAPLLGDTLNAVVEELALEPREIDLLLDYESIPAEHTSALTVALSSTLLSLPRVAEWRSLTVAAGSFPRNLAGVPTNSVGYQLRAEWKIWRDVIENSSVPRLPAFGDYGIEHPDLAAEVEPWKYTIIPQLRYATEDGWLLFKVSKGDLEPFGPFRDICQDLVGRQEYSGSSFSWGDEYVSNCSGGSEKTGNATTWRRIGSNHHMTLVVDQIASLP